MSSLLCFQEQQILEAVRSGQWPEALRTHLAGCAICQESAEIAACMRGLAELEEDDCPLPDPRLIWMKAQIADRRARAAQVLKPLETFQRVAWTVLTLAASLSLVVKWPLIEKAVSQINSSSKAVFVAAGFPFLFPVLIILALSLLGLATTFSLYALLRRN